MLKINFVNQTKRRFVYKKRFTHLATIILKNENLVQYDSEVSLIIIEEEEMKNLCQKYYFKKNNTDVLAFPNEWKNLAPLIKMYSLGDIYISVDMVQIQARKYQHSLTREWTYLFCHSFFHLLGYEHETLDDEKMMHNKVVNVINLKQTKFEN